MQSIITGAVAFATTNIDDIFVLMALFSQVNGHSLQIKHIITGQFLGIFTLTFLSMVGALGVFFIPASWIGFLGLVPLYLGIKWLIGLRKRDEEDVVQVSKDNTEDKEFNGDTLALKQDKGLKILFGPSTLKVAAITFGNGGDNIAIYIPLFASGNVISALLIVIVFIILIAVWCFVGYILVNHSFIAKGIQKYGRFIIPLVFVGLGIFIMYHCGTLEIIFGN
jgi:cadmium resistance transport/sequestration family protein